MESGTTVVIATHSNEPAIATMNIGATTIVAGTEARGIEPKWQATIGMVTSHADTDPADNERSGSTTTSTSRSPRMRRRPNQVRRTHGPTTTRPSVAITLSWKPTRSTIAGSNQRSTAAATPITDSPRGRRFERKHTVAMMVVANARQIDGLGVTPSENPTSTVNARRRTQRR